jgi:hypothetical protein
MTTKTAKAAKSADKSENAPTAGELAGRALATIKKRKATKRANAAAKAAGKGKPEPKAAKAKPATERADGLRPGSKMATAVDMVLRKQGATCPEIAEALGWAVLNAATLKRFAAASKVKLREDDSEKPSRFFGTPNA